MLSVEAKQMFVDVFRKWFAVYQKVSRLEAQIQPLFPNFDDVQLK